MNEKKKMSLLLQNRVFEATFEPITDSNWWSDDSMATTVERERLLYQAYFTYYDLLTIEGVQGIEGSAIADTLHRLKLQLDVEIDKVRKGILEPLEISK